MNQRSLLNRRHTQPSFDVIQPFLNLPSLFSSTFKNLFCTWLSNSIFRTRWRWRCTTGVGCSNYSYVDDGGRTMLVDWVSIRVLYGLSWVRSVASADKNPNRFNLNTSFPLSFTHHRRHTPLFRQSGQKIASNLRFVPTNPSAKPWEASTLKSYQRVGDVGGQSQTLTKLMLFDSSLTWGGADAMTSGLIFIW